MNYFWLEALFWKLHRIENKRWNVSGTWYKPSFNASLTHKKGSLGTLPRCGSCYGWEAYTIYIHTYISALIMFFSSL